jgi:fission process protein 1
MVPVKLVYFSYLVSSAYVLSHSVARGSVAMNRQLAAQQRARDLSKDDKNLHYRQEQNSPTKAFVDTLVWQGLASVIIPGFVINRTCALSRLVLHRFFRRRSLNLHVKKWTVTAIGLGSIPFIIQPIDRCVFKL